MIPPFLTKIFGGKASDIIKSITEGADAIFTSKEEKAAFELKATQELNRHFEQIETNVLKEIELMNANTDSARRREIELAKASGHADYLQWFLAMSAMVIFFYLAHAVVNGLVKEENSGLAHNLMGIVEGIVLSIFNYYFGSSVSSRLKDMKKGS